jgi:hypothetical protein
MMQRFTRQFLLRGAVLVAVLTTVACACSTSSDVTPASTAPDGICTG